MSVELPRKFDQEFPKIPESPLEKQEFSKIPESHVKKPRSKKKE